MNVLLLFFLLSAPQDSEKDRQAEMEKRKKDSAVWRARNYLTSQLRKGMKDAAGQPRLYDELVLYTMVHAGADPTDKSMKLLLQRVIEKPLTSTYQVAFRAMALEAMDGAKYRKEIAKCAQYLVDQQSKLGGWGYGGPAQAMPEFTEETKGGGSTRTRIRIRKRKLNKGMPTDDDWSNSQYAVLGLRACARAGIEVPEEVLETGLKSWEKGQRPDGSWGYGRQGTNAGEGGYGSMTAGGIASIIVLNKMLGKKWDKNKSIQYAMKWLKANWTVTENPKYPDPQMWVFYYLYALERIGSLGGYEKIGGQDWYPQGLKQLMDAQQRNGSWKGSDQLPIANTCFAVLFIQKATKKRPSIASKVEERKEK